MSFDQMPRTPHSLRMLKGGCGDNWNCVYSSGARFPPSTVAYNHTTDTSTTSINSDDEYSIDETLFIVFYG